MTEALNRPAPPLRLTRPVLRQTTLTLIVATYIMLVLNLGFWGHVARVFDDSPLQMVLFGLAFWALTVLTLEFFGPWRLQKPVAALLILMAAGAQYYERNFGVVIDREMVRNVFQTTFAESRHLVTWGSIWQIGLTGALPAALVFWLRVQRLGPWHQLWRWPLGVALAFALLTGALFSQFKAFSAAIRAESELTATYQPGATIAALAKYGKEQWRSAATVVRPIGTDARPGPRLAAAQKPVLLVIWAGETARAQNFGLNGYARDTTPGLRERGVINFADTRACGTSTAVSLPCMFSALPQAGYSRAAFLGQENLLDVLARAGMDVQWYDNNTGDQGIAPRTGWSRVDATLDPEACKVECTDDVFLPLIERTMATMTRNTVLVLHMIGSHGPAYYLRYPQERAVFQPECKTSEFSACTVEQIVNTYDNTILQTDYVLSRSIDMLAAADRVVPAMIYMSDHGESLGEDGLYLHAAPSFMAPDVQTRVPFVMWLSPAFRQTMALDDACLQAAARAPVSHDNLFHSVLGLLDVTTSVRDPGLDLTAACRTAETG